MVLAGGFKPHPHVGTAKVDRTGNLGGNGRDLRHYEKRVKAKEEVEATE
jgi:hypothetical protein